MMRLSFPAASAVPMASMALVLLAALTAIAPPASAATTTYHGEGYTLQYETGTVFGDFRAAASGIDRRFGWDSAFMSFSNTPWVGRATTYDLRTYALPTLTVTADPGHLLSGLSLKVYGAVGNNGIADLAWDAFLFDYRFTVGGVGRSLAASLVPPPGHSAPPGKYTYWTLTERYAGPPGFSSFSLRADLAMVLIAGGDLTERQAIAVLEDPGRDYLLQFDFRVDPLDLTTGVPTGATAPVPEPEAWGMLVAGLGLLARVGRRKSRSLPPSPSCPPP